MPLIPGLQQTRLGELKYSYINSKTQAGAQESSSLGCKVHGLNPKHQGKEPKTNTCDPFLNRAMLPGLTYSVESWGKPWPSTAAVLIRGRVTSLTIHPCPRKVTPS